MRKLYNQLRHIAATTSHRPWPKPAAPWLMHQRWLDLLFAHWPIPVEEMRVLVPPQLELDTYDGQAWIGVVPFRMTHVRPRWVPPVPGLSAFPELNVRTYVKARNPDAPKPGVYFFSLDAANRLAVEAARAGFMLPYFHAHMALTYEASAIDYRSRRIHTGAPPAHLVMRYAPTGGIIDPPPDSLDRWLTERYALYTVNRRGRVYRGNIHHLVWPLQPAEAEFEVNTMAEAVGLRLPDIPPLLHFARRMDVLIWPLESVSHGSDK